jgi:hypothetical protein
MLRQDPAEIDGWCIGALGGKQPTRDWRDKLVDFVNSYIGQLFDTSPVVRHFVYSTRFFRLRRGSGA